MTTNKIQENQAASFHKRKWVSFSNISTVILFVFVVTLFISPSVKGRVIQGLMKVGLFQPDIPDKPSENHQVAVVQQAASPEVLFTDDEGNTVKLSEQKGKVVFMNFWATWCPPCIAEMPGINSLYEKYKNNDKVLFLMVDVDSKMKKSTAFMKRKEFSLPVYLAASEMPSEYFAGSMPTTVILDKSGNIAFHHVGGADYSNPKVAEFINKLIK
ncbi:thioredoxin, putative [Arcticibacter svalbardensis MN12-7]|uniref:Thioredoxin, putative n=1 Tax=Arcticibacter svalbardensis MN12-7 TaxID=1150600 RepID=R9GWR5_9SPHI|nr:TlpA disulfide reductase family protein [Arcticibacter svalbardensis]EOR93404.1 thioredoxin, putative [Arcticibacter svalbardensis MN12-7]